MKIFVASLVGRGIVQDYENTIRKTRLPHRKLQRTFRQGVRTTDGACRLYVGLRLFRLFRKNLPRVGNHCGD